jgi:ADP-heptose:LPS heptosyltransferase
VNPQKNILLIRFKAIGDVVLTLPAVHAVRENFPAANMVFFTVSENTPLLQGFRDVNDVISLDRSALKSPWRAGPEFFRLLRNLRGRKFSLVVDFQGYGETAWLTRLTGARERWGTVYGRGREWAYTRGLRRDESLHPADGNLSLLRACGLKITAIKNQFQLPADALAAANKIFAANKIDVTKPTLFLQPFTSSPHKNWPLENYLAVARHWRTRGVQIIFGGGPGDLAALAPARAEKFLVLAGVPLLVTGGLMELSTLVLGGDTGMLHLAIAQGKRALMLVSDLAPGRPILFQHRDWVIAAPDKRDLASITVEAVLAETGKVFNPPVGNVAC